MTRPEILAPVGGEEQLTAAVRCGTDAVYLGLRDLNARRNAANFGEEELRKAVSYCHQRGVKVYVTVNTMLTDSELPQLEQAAETIAAAGTDGVILQDMAALRLFAGRWPSVHRVASTQTAVHNADGAKFLQDCGFNSFVLARELSLKEMETICSAVSIPAEAFVHGAHCVCMSGACYLSAMLGGRSGNRGLCAQPCRLDWHSGKTQYALSMKDMSLIGHVQQLADAGVATLKIEGRMKRPEYVAAAVTACRQALNGEAYDAQALRAVFSRSGFTDGYLAAQRGQNMFGYRTKEDVTDADSVLKTLSGLYHKETPLIPVDMRFSADETGSRLTLTDGTRTTEAAGPVPEAARTRALDAESAEKNLTKTGGTQYYANQFTADIQPGLMLPASALNAMRREALESLDAQRGTVPAIRPEPFDFSAAKPYIPRPEPALWARFYTAGQITGAEHFEKLLLPLHEITPALLERFGEKLIAELPACCFPDREPAVRTAVQDLAREGLTAVWAQNIYGIRLGQDLGLAVHGGWGLNIANTQSLLFYEQQGMATVTLSFELSMAKLRDIGGTLPRGLAAYGRLPLMRYRACPLRASIGCAACGGHGSLTDRKGIEFPVECGKKQYSSLLNSVPLHIAGRETPADYLLLYFTRETPAEIRTVTDDFLLGRRTEQPHSNGLYYRTLL